VLIATLQFTLVPKIYRSYNKLVKGVDDVLVNVKVLDWEDHQTSFGRVKTPDSDTSTTGESLSGCLLKIIRTISL
jgi:hypothetical protein